MSVSEEIAGIDDPEAVKAEWLERLEAPVADIKGWPEASGWRTRRVTMMLTERRLGSYKVPLLLMEKDTAEVVLNPGAWDGPGAAGAVDLYLAPGYDDIASLDFEDDRWVVHYVAPLNLVGSPPEFEIRPMPFSEATIRSILDGMVAHA